MLIERRAICERCNDARQMKIEETAGVVDRPRELVRTSVRYRMAPEGQKMMMVAWTFDGPGDALDLLLAARAGESRPWPRPRL